MSMKDYSYIFRGKVTLLSAPAIELFWPVNILR
jgi:hypothetical protein